MVSLSLQLDWKPNAQFAGILIAHHLNRYADQGIDLDIHPWQPYLNQVDILQQDGNYLVSTEDNLLIRGRVAGQPVKAIATMMQYSGLGWMALKSSKISSIADFKGKRVGIHGDGETGLNITLKQFGLTNRDVEVVEVGFDYADLLRSNEFDAVQCLVMVEPLELAAEGFDLHVMPAYEWGYEVYSQVIATTDRLIKAEPETLKQFLKITFEGWRYAFSHPKETAQIIVDKYLGESNSKMQEEIITALNPLFLGRVGMEKLGWMTTERWDKSIRYLEDYQIINRSLQAEDVMTNQFMEQLYS
ncbi:ABC transporter substrate-binding protein [Phormidium tenue FACHB-886]|nr:ABC transporter substrate-binding protein [Phormidium tenue FACHB-886]